MGKGVGRVFSALVVAISILALGAGPAVANVPPAEPGGDNPTMQDGAQSLNDQLGEDAAANLLALDNQYVSSRTAGDRQLSLEEVGRHRSEAADQGENVKNTPKSGPVTFDTAWTGIGPDPIVQIGRSDSAAITVTGRVGALAIRKDGTYILGAAQGGIWTYDSNAAVPQWINRTDNLPSLSTGALALAPSNDLVVYDGTGEGALSGDSYFGNGILRSTDGGFTWSHVSGDFFLGVSISRLAVDPADADHLYASVLRGRGGTRRVSPPVHSTFGLWESKDGGVSWTLLKPAPAGSLGATDIRLDPQSTDTLYASFWGDKLYKSTDGGASWNPIMNGLPANADFSFGPPGPTRFSIALSHPAGAPKATLYAGLDWTDTSRVYHNARVFKSTDEGASWVELPNGACTSTPKVFSPCQVDTVFDYCGAQCFYDNVVEADPSNPDVVYVGGNFGYSMPTPSGGIFRSDDGGQTWENLGWDLHPDFHALAFDPNNPDNVLIGNDGGVWFSPDRGGRLNSDDTLTGAALAKDLGTADFQNFDLNCCGLTITQFTSIATNPTRTARIWGGSQDNGTERKSATSNTWFDLASGDGGQVLVDPTDSRYIYGTYFGISPYRFTDSGDHFFTNAFITNGINLKDRSEFYTPFVLNQLNPNQLFLGTYRLYRTDNAKAASASDVHWSVISPDLTTGCTGASPNGARNCTISAIGVGGGTALYSGSLDGLIFFSPNAQTSLHPTWTRVGVHGNEGNPHSLPNRPVAWIAVDRSNYRVAYVAFNGYNAATPRQPGHIFKTTNAGESWSDISGNLPDVPVNSLAIDASYPNTLYAATDVGPFVTYNDGASWSGLGTGFPIVAVDQIDLDPHHRMIAAGTHGRGAWKITDNSPAAPALVISKVDAGVPVGPASNIDYTITLRNIGNAAATGITIRDSIPENTSFVSADSGGVNDEESVTWAVSTLAAGAQVSVHLRVQIDPSLKSRVISIIDQTFGATSAEGETATGSPTVTPIAPPFAVSAIPTSQIDGARVGHSVNYQVTLTDLGFKSDSYAMASTGGTFPVSFSGADCTTPLTATPTVSPGGSTSVCVRVDVPASAADAATSTATVTAKSVGSASVTASVTVKTIAVAVNTLVVDDDAFVPSNSANVDVNKFYTDALTAAGVHFQLWDLGADKSLPMNYMKSFNDIVWFTGNSFPAPIGRYEAQLKSFLDGGGHFFLSGQDLLDQAAGLTPFVRDYLHVTWNDALMNDKLTRNVKGVTGTITAGVGTVPIDDTVLQNDFMDRIAPNGGAAGIFTDDAGQSDGLQFSGTYKVVFLAFPFEEYGTAAQRTDLVTRVFTFFGS